MSNDKKGKSLFAMIFGTTGKPKDVKPEGGFIQNNYGNHVDNNHGTVTQVGGGSSSFKTGMVFGAPRTLTVNGRQYTGRSVTQKGGRIFVDDRDVTDEVEAPTNAREITIVVQGDVEKLEAYGDQRITIDGDVGSIETTSGSIDIKGIVTGNVASMSGPIVCGKVSGSVKSVSGPIQAG
jgi:hypothetical protein